MTGGLPAGTGAARCTVIIPARNAADTIEETLASVRAQTLTGWQALVVDDGSTDQTAAVVRTLAESDRRIRLIPGPGRGPGAARNVGIQSATTPLVSFLDADDLLAPEFFERLVLPLESSLEVAATYTGWLRLAPDGSTEQGPCPDVDGDLFDLFAAACVFPPHACVVRRSVVQDAGGFDEQPTTTEDWDLWQRIARTGARFTRVPGTRVSYRMRAGSRSRDSRRVLQDGLAVIAQGHAPDARVRQPHPSHEAGLDSSLLGRNSYNHLSWAAGMALASDEDPSPLLSAIQELTATDLDPWGVGGTLLESMRVTRCAPPAAALTLISPRAEDIMVFLVALEKASRAPDLALRVARAIDSLASQQDESSRPRTLLTTHEVAVELTQPLVGVSGLPARIDRLRAWVAYGGESIGEIELPVGEGRVESSAIADAASDLSGWRLLEMSLAHPLSDASGWEMFVQALFGLPGNSLSEIYDAGTRSEPMVLLPGQRALEVDVSDQLLDVRIDADALVVRCTVGGALLGDVSVPTVNGVVAAGSIRRAMTDTRPNDLVQLVTREGIIGWPRPDGSPLRTRLAERRAHRKSSS